MNKRSKSSVQLSALTEKLVNKTSELENIQLKVQRSKPILQTIYSKFKLKQSLYINRLENQKKNLQESKELTQEYKKLFEDGVKILQKSKIYEKDKYQGNYLQPTSIIKAKDQQKNQSIYQQYKEKVEWRTNRGLEEQRNPEVKKLQKQTKQICQHIKKSIDKLRMVRSKSQQLIKKCQNKKVMKKKANIFQSQMNESQIKQRILKKQKQKFSKIK